MAETVVALPVSVEQIAAVVRQMSPAARRRLLDLAPELRQSLATRTLAEARASADQVQAQVHQVIASSEPFLGQLTLGQYLDLADNQRASLWESFADTTWVESEEREVKPDALLAG